MLELHRDDIWTGEHVPACEVGPAFSTLVRENSRDNPNFFLPGVVAGITGFQKLFFARRLDRPWRSYGRNRASREKHRAQY